MFFAIRVVLLAKSFAIKQDNICKVIKEKLFFLEEH